MRHRLLRHLALLAAGSALATACTVTVPDSLVADGGGGDGGNITTDTTVGDGGEDDGHTTVVTIDDGDQGDGGTDDRDRESTLDPEIENVLASFGPWTASELPPFTDDRNLQPYEFVTPERVKVSCELSDRVIPATEFTEFAAFPFTGDKLPGLIVEGQGIEDGDLKVLPLRRSAVPLVINLASEAPSVVVDSPDPSSLQGAVSELMRTADSRVSGLPVVPANIRFVHREVSSYEEAVLNMGVSLRYKGGGFKGKFESEFEQSTTSERHTVVARLLQPMFTISTDKSRITSAGDYLDPSTTKAEIDTLVGQNRMGADNPPVLIDAVTYGRVVYLTVTSDKVSSADELKLAVSGAYGGFSGDAEVANKNRRIVSESEIKVEAFGGDDDVALQALKDGTIQAFMESVNTATAAPLSMVLRTLDGTKLTVTGRGHRDRHRVPPGGAAQPDRDPDHHQRRCLGRAVGQRFAEADRQDQ